MSAAHAVLKPYKIPESRHERFALWNSFANGGELESLFELAMNWMRQGADLSQRDLTLLLRVTRRRGAASQLSRALSWVLSIAEQPDRVLLQEILSAYRRLGRMAEAERAFSAAEQRGTELGCFHYTTMIALCADQRDGHRAAAYLSAMRARQIQPDKVLYTALISAYGQAGLLGEAQQVFDALRRPGAPIDAALGGALIDALIVCAASDRLQALLTELQQVGIEGTAAECRVLLLLFCRTGFPNEAEFVANHMHQKSQPIDEESLDCLTMVYQQAGQTQRAQETRQRYGGAQPASCPKGGPGARRGAKRGVREKP